MRLTIVNLFCAPDLAPTGHLVAALAAHRSRLGDEVTVVAGRGGYLGGAPPEDAAGHGFRIERVRTAGLGKANAAARLTDYVGFLVGALVRLLTLPAQDVVVCLTTPPYIVAVGLAHRLLHRRCRVVLWCMDCYPDALEAGGVARPGGIVVRYLRGLNRLLYRHLDAAVCLDDAMRERVTRDLPPGRKAVVVSNWESGELFADPAGVPAWPEAPQLEGRTTILYLGNAGRGHSFDTVLEAARRLRGEPFGFLFVGGGAEWSRLDAARRLEGLDNLVLRGYVGAKERTLAVLASAQCALITMRESMRGVVSPSKLYASLAMGLPILYVGPEGTNVDTAIRTHECGISLREGEVDAFLAFVRRLAEDPAGTAAMRQRSREAFETSYNDGAVLPRLDAVIDGASASTDPTGAA